MELSVKTNTGKVFEVDHCVSTTIGYLSVLYIEFVGYEMTAIFPVFSNTEETIAIQGLVDGKLSKTYTNYTKLAEIFIVPDTDGHVRIRLEQPTEVDRLGE